MAVVKRALLSCYDKTGLDALAKALAELGVELIASCGTAEFLTQQGLRVKTVEEFAGIAEQLDGRVKTLHPKIHAGILARRDVAAHQQAVGAAGFIDLVVVNLYPFQQTAQRAGVSLAEAVEQIDVGGVALLRAAAKNFAHVAVVSQVQQYPAVIEALRRGKGQVPEPLRRQLAASAFELTSRYDMWISGTLATPASRRGGPSREAGASENGPSASGASGATLPEEASVIVQKRQPLRYGENPHQQAAWYLPSSGAAWALGTLRQLQGKELSYNNLLDLDAALRSLLDVPDPACVIIKHHSLCGLATPLSAGGPAPGGAGAATLSAAYERAHACDPESAFGGVVGCNRPIEASLAEQLTATFLEVIIAPSVEAEAAPVLAKKPNLRVVTVAWPTPPLAGWGLEWRQLLGGWLLQEPVAPLVTAETLKAVTVRAPTAPEQADLVFAWQAVRHVTSNGIVIAKDRATVGIGQGQPSRVGSVRLAIEKAGPRSRGAVAASDGFFPFPDSIELLANAGVTAVIQPGGSMRDAEVTAAADRATLAMCVTGTRAFRH